MRAAVLHEHGHLAVVELCATGHFTARRARLQGVHQQVEEHLFQPVVVTVHLQVGGQIARDARPGPVQRADEQGSGAVG